MRYPTLLFAVFLMWLGWTGCAPDVVSPSEVQRQVEIPTRDSLARFADIYLPSGYFSNTRERYPVLYMLDGQTLFTPDSSQMNGASWQIDTLLDRLIAANEIRPCIVVGLHNNYRRILEYLPNKGFDQWPDSTRQRFLRGYKEPEGDWFLQVLTQDIKPWVDAEYRTLKDQEHTFVGGAVSGAMIALYAMTEYPDIFSGAICMSTHWPISPMDLFPDAARATISLLGAELPDPATHLLYFDLGGDGMDAYYEPYQKQMDELVKAKGYEYGKTWVTLRYPGQVGTPEIWGERFQEPLKFMLSGEVR